MRLGDICSFEYGSSLPDRDRKAGEVPVYGSNGIVGAHDAAVADGPAIIIGRKGSIGEVHLSDRSCWPIDTTYFIDKRFTECDLQWLSFCLKSLRLSELNKASGVPGLNREDAYGLEVVVPDIREQRRIAAHLKAQLAAVEEARKAAQAQLRDFKRLIPSILEAAFLETAGAELVRIGDVAKTTSGTTPSRGKKEYWESPKYPWVKTGEVAFKPIRSTEEGISEVALAECSLPLLPPGTVLIAMYGQGKTRGQSAILEVKATTNQACFAILPNESFDQEYLQFWLRLSYEAMRSMSEARGGNQSNLNGEILNGLEVPLIPRTRQQAIAKAIKSSFEEAECLEAALLKQMDDIERISDRLLAQAFSEA